MRTPSIFRSTLLAVLVFAAAACSRDGADAAKNQAAAPPPPEVAVIEARYGSAVLRRELPGRLEAYRTAQVLSLIHI